MNFPDLETCKAIASEFPNTEYSYYLLPSTKNPYEKLAPNIIKSDCPCSYEKLAPAPTCEELGEWLWLEKIINLRRVSQDIWEVRRLALNEKVLFEITIENGTETQARAEAVKLILEEK